MIVKVGPITLRVSYHRELRIRNPANRQYKDSKNLGGT